MWEDRWTPREKKFALAGGICVAILGIVMLFLWLGGEEEKKSDWASYDPAIAKPKKEEEKKGKKEPTVLMVDVKGAVKKPGVYQLQSGDRVQDAVTKAGGPTAKADMNQVNLAQPLADGTALYIPAKGEKITSPSANASPSANHSSASGSSTGGVINLNTATVEELDTLNGIGPTKAQAIIRYREENGLYLGGSADRGTRYW